MIMFPPELKELHPYLSRLLSNGIKTDGQIDPIVHNQVFKLNLEQEKNYTVSTHLSSCTIHYSTYPICQLRWLDDGVEFFPIRDCYPILGMMAAVLNTINELKEGN